MKVIYLNCGLKGSLRCAIFMKKMFSLLRPSPQENKQTNKDNKKEKQSKMYEQKILITKIARRRGFKPTTFMLTPTCISTYSERNDGELNDFIA